MIIGTRLPHGLWDVPLPLALRDASWHLRLLCLLASASASASASALTICRVRLTFDLRLAADCLRLALLRPIKNGILLMVLRLPARGQSRTASRMFCLQRQWFTSYSQWQCLPLAYGFYCPFKIDLQKVCGVIHWDTSGTTSLLLLWF